MLRWIVLAVALRAAFGASAWVTRGESAFLQQDSRAYLALAAPLAADGAFENATGEPEVFRTPGYPLLIALGAKLGAAMPVTLAIQVALSALVMMLVFAIVERATGNERRAVVAAAAAGLEPTLFFWSIQIMPEILLAVALLASAWSAQRFFERPGPWWATATALSLSAAAYVKPIAYPFVMMASVAAVLWALFTRSRSDFRAAACVFAVVCASLLGLWHVRNSATAGYRGFSTQIDHALYLSGAGAVRARLEGATYADVRLEMLATAAEVPATAGPGRPSRFQMMRRVGWETFSSEPLTFASVHAAGVVRTLFDPGAVEYFRLFGVYPENGGLLGTAVDRGLVPAVLEMARTRRALWWSMMALALMTWPYVTAPAWFVWRESGRLPPAGLFAAACAAYLIVAGGGVPGSSRFRAPAVPLLVITAVLAGSGGRRGCLPLSPPDR